MKLTKTNVPKGASYKVTKWQRIFEEFMNMNTKCVKLSVDSEDSYKSPNSFYSSCHKAIKVWHVPVRVTSVNNEVYLIRTDMEEETTERES
jgi:hypothetical protein